MTQTQFETWQDALAYVRENGTIRYKGKIAIAYVTPWNEIRLRPSPTFYGCFLSALALDNLSG